MSSWRRSLGVGRWQPPFYPKERRLSFPDIISVAGKRAARARARKDQDGGGVVEGEVPPWRGADLPAGEEAGEGDAAERVAHRRPLVAGAVAQHRLAPHAGEEDGRLRLRDGGGQPSGRAHQGAVVAHAEPHVVPRLDVPQEGDGPRGIVEQPHAAVEPLAVRPRSLDDQRETVGRGGHGGELAVEREEAAV